MQIYNILLVHCTVSLKEHWIKLANNRNKLWIRNKIIPVTTLAHGLGCCSRDQPSVMAKLRLRSVMQSSAMLGRLGSLPLALARLWNQQALPASAFRGWAEKEGRAWERDLSELPSDKETFLSLSPHTFSVLPSPQLCQRPAAHGS